MDKIAMLFGVNRVYLEDQASVKEHRIDLTLLSVMKDSLTFYERYGYNVCVIRDVTQVSLDVHKSLLRNFRFDIFLQLLTSTDYEFVLKTLAKMNKQYTDFTLLHEFWTTTDNYYVSRHSQRRRMILQAILLDSTYPWFSMVHVIQTQKLCMEKLYN